MSMTVVGRVDGVSMNTGVGDGGHAARGAVLAVVGLLATPFVIVEAGKGGLKELWTCNILDCV